MENNWETHWILTSGFYMYVPSCKYANIYLCKYVHTYIQQKVIKLKLRKHYCNQIVIPYSVWKSVNWGSWWQKSALVLSWLKFWGKYSIWFTIGFGESMYVGLKQKSQFQWTHLQKRVMGTWRCFVLFPGIILNSPLPRVNHNLEKFEVLSKLFAYKYWWHMTNAL